MLMMAFYLDFLLDVNNLQSSLAYPVVVAGYEVAVVSLAVPKTFDNTVEFIRLQANFISTQPFYDGRNLLLTTPVHDSHDGKYFIYEPPNPQYRPVFGGPLTDIRFTLLDENDKPISFEIGKILVVLHFKPKY